MLARIAAILGVMTLSASAQTPPKAPVATSPASKAFCERVAAIAFESNRGLSTANTGERRSAPFVANWLVSTAWQGDPDKGGERIGRIPDCDRGGGPVSRCDWRDANDFGIPDRGDVYRLNGPEAYEEFERWHSAVGLLPYLGGFVEVKAYSDTGGGGRYSNATGAFIKSVIGKQGLMCGFDNRIHETYLPQNGERMDSCAALLSDGSEILTPQAMEGEDLRYKLFAGQDDYRPADFFVKGDLKVDVDGDGVDEHLIQLNWTAGNLNCGWTYYDVLDANDPGKFGAAPVRKLVADAQGERMCDREVRLRRKNGRVLFEIAGVEPVQKQSEPIVTRYGGALERTLRDIKDSKARTLCTTIFAIEPVVRFPR